jgi:hypothetical protein
LLNNKTITETFSTTPSIETIVRSIKTDSQFSSIGAFVNQLEFGAQTDANIQVRAYA